MSLKIGKGFSLPVDVAGEAIAILAKRGAGKTNTATVLVEELVSAGVQTVILDPVGAWWGIRANAEGEARGGLGVPVLGGKHGDVPLEQTAGALIAQVAVESGESLLLDLSDFPSKASVGRFVTDFAEKLYSLKGRADSLLHLVLEEADMFAPQRVKGSERMQGAIEQLVRRGRARGIGLTMISQRSASLSKDVLTQADVLVVMRTTGPHDIRAVKEWVEARGDEHGQGVIESLPSLTTGEAWFWNPERELLHRVQVRPRKTFDSSRTPRANEVRVEPKSVAPIDLTALGAEIQATAERVKADDPAALRRRINELTRELERQPDAPTPVVETVEVPTPVFDGEPEMLNLAVEAVNEIITACAEQVEMLKEAARMVADAVVAANRPAAPTRTLPSATRTPPRPVERPVRAVAPTSENGELKRPEQKVVDAVAWLESMGLAGEKQRVGFLAGYSPGSGNFNNILGTLRSRGIVDYARPGVVALTASGNALANPPPTAVTTIEMQTKVMEKLKRPQQNVLQHVIDCYPNHISKTGLAEAVGYSAGSGNFNNILGSLRSLGLIDYPTPGWVVAEPVLFIE